MADTVCLRPGCGGKPITRGVCCSCYHVARDLIRNKKTTWKELEAKGKVLPTKTSKVNKAKEWLLE